MSSTVRRINPSEISSTLKEAVVDSLVNLTYGRISGHGVDGEVLFGARPRAVLSSGFLLPPLKLEGPGDEVTQPIRISAHGLDFQAKREPAGTIRVRPSFSVYLRVLPNQEDLKRPECRAKFRLSDTVSKMFRTRVREALAARWAEEAAKGKYSKRWQHPEWKTIDASIRQVIREEMGIPADFTRIFSTEELDPSEEAEDGSQEAIDAPSEVLQNINDDLFEPMEVPHKWVRIDLPPDKIPELVIQSGMSQKQVEERCREASVALTSAVRKQMEAWVESPDGHQWCYRRGIKVKLSEYRGWDDFLARVRNDQSLQPAVPEITLEWNVRVTDDWTQSDLQNVHISIENRSAEAARGDYSVDQCVFQAAVSVTIAKQLFAPLKLGRVEPSYRYNKYLDYPAIGFNGGVYVAATSQEEVALRTTWAPRYTQPRILPRNYPTVDPNIFRLSKPGGLDGILRLVDELERWYSELDTTVNPLEGLLPQDQSGAERETAGFAADKQGWRKEIDAVRVGFSILSEAQAHWERTEDDPARDCGKACVFEAWLAMNETMSNVMRERIKSTAAEWRLFQLAFIVAHVPAMASRIPSFAEFYSRTRDDTVTLLYFATGGGKSEAFFGLLTFTLFLDRLRGKTSGVTAMIRYPLRLLTIQQAQRCAKVLAHAELVRVNRKIGGDSFQIGFWVGRGGSPNRHADPAVSEIPDIDKYPADVESETTLISESPGYEVQKAAWNKLPSCPFCAAPTVLRRFAREGGTVAHVCSEIKCASNDTQYRPLPFLICDEDIYDFAPAVLLGTVDKLALIGQSTPTLRRIYGMFGAAPFVNKTNRRLVVPLQPRDFENAIDDENLAPIFPAFENGKRHFYDPFPALVIQDEAHLLDESLGTFAGLFESALDAILSELARPLEKLIIFEPNSSKRRRAKVIAASATVSDPDRQLEHLYQRPVPAMQFPYPGESLYSSFYAAPAKPTDPDQERSQLENIEMRSQWSRVYAAFLTNGRAHTATTVAVLSNFHTIISELFALLTSEEKSEGDKARMMMMSALSEWVLAETHHRAMKRASVDEIATLIDLHRIALTYVTNKKGGDQIAAAEYEETRKRHVERGLDISELRAALITGSVSQGEIQETVSQAQARSKPGDTFQSLDESLRSIVATSAVSHGVDVEEFNSMFFAGMPSDIAEYIQASSRIGRTHVGFVVLVPTPQRRRDRYIVEVFDSYHRFLERMVSPAAIDRWAGRAIERALPSFLQAYLAGVTYLTSGIEAPPNQKHLISDLSWIPSAVKLYKGKATSGPFVEKLCSFLQRAIGLEDESFAPGAKEHYQELIRQKVESTLSGWARDPLGQEQYLHSYFRSQDSALKKPMTSLRDVDEVGEIRISGRDLNRRPMDAFEARKVMRFIRRGVSDEA